MLWVMDRSTRESYPTSVHCLWSVELQDESTKTWNYPIVWVSGYDQQGGKKERMGEYHSCFVFMNCFQSFFSLLMDSLSPLESPIISLKESSHSSWILRTLLILPSFLPSYTAILIQIDAFLPFICMYSFCFVRLSWSIKSLLPLIRSKWNLFNHHSWCCYFSPSLVRMLFSLP